MSAHSSGYYSIDADYNIIGFNDTAKQLYASLEIGQKCYKALMGLDAPCPPCPVANGILGPKTYLDPIRHIYETVDAVETVLADGSRGHALVFSTVAEGERLASAIPTGEASLRLLGAINLLTSKYIAVLDVNVFTGRISVYRCAPAADGGAPILEDNALYRDSLEACLAKYAFPEERTALAKAMELDGLRTRLAQVPSFKVHCKLNLGQAHYYCITVARNGEADSFEDIVLAVACEDDDVNTRRIYEKQLEALLSSITHVPGYFHLDITENRILRVGGRSEFVQGFDPNVPIDVLMHAMSEYIIADEDRRDFMDSYRLESMRRAYDAGRVELIRESLCDYDDHIPRWSRYTARLFVNPANNHLEAVFFGEDISRDKDARETQMSIIQSLARNYLDVLLLDVRTNAASVIKSRSILSDGLARTDSGEYDYDQLVESYIAENVHPEDREMLREAMKRRCVQEQLTKNPEYVGTYRTLRDGEAHYYQYRFIRNPEYGSVVLGLADVDSVVAREREQQETLRQALEAAKRANAEKSRFLARMSHDMRTPLNGILGILEIDNKHANDIEYLQRNRSKAAVVTNHLIAIINDVLDMAKIEDGSLNLAHEPFDIIAEGREANLIINLQAQERGIEIILNVEPWEKRLSYVYGSPLHLRRALMNIYSNCIKYNREHGSITTDVRVVASDAERVTYQWVIRDTGVGMSPDFLPKLFEPFVQEKVDSRSVYEGTGLGMSISKALIEQMGGTLEVASELGVGSSFTVTIPFDLAREEDLYHVVSEAPASIAGVRILLVEDNELNREVAETLLLEEGALVTSAVNGREAVAAVEADADAFDVILMDVMMPVMDGYEATRCLRKRGVATPIIAMTANAFSEDVQACLDAGMNAHVAKPIDLGRLIRLIAHFAKGDSA